MNDEELRAFLDSATVGEGSAAKQAAREETPSPETVTPAAGSESMATPPSAPSKREPGVSFEDLIGSRRNGEPAAESEPDLVPLVLPDPHSVSAAAQHITPLHLPEPTRPYQVDSDRSGVSAGQSVSVSETGDFPPTEPLARVDMPVATGASQPRETPEIHDAARTAPLAATAAAVAPELFGSSNATGQSDYEAIAVTGGESSTKRWLPWVIVGGGAAIALIASFLVVNAVTGGDPGSSTATSSPTSEVSEPAESASPKPSVSTEANDTDEEKTDEETEVDPTQPPIVEVGPTMSLPVSQWAVTAQLSSRFGQSFYNINAADQLVLTSSLIDSLPESCAAMRQQWGIQRVDGTKFEVLKPETRCAEAPELYDELWGLTAAMVASVTPQ